MYSMTQNVKISQYYEPILRNNIYFTCQQIVKYSQLLGAGQTSTNTKENKHEFLYNVITKILRNEPKFNVSPKKIVLDFSSPNIAKPFHAGHLRSTIIGNFIANIHKHYNDNVVKINYLGDWGTQFGLLQYGLQTQNVNLNKLQNFKELYDVYVNVNKQAETDETVYNEARKYFSDIEQGKISLENWRKLREVTVEELQKVYNRLSISFDAYHWESDYNGSAIKDMIEHLQKLKIIKTDETGKVFATVHNKDITFLKSDKSTLYLTRDVAALMDRYKKYNFDKMLYIVDKSQADHFATVFEIVKKCNQKYVEGCEHVKFGRIKGMSTRKGNAIFLNDILDEAKQKMYEKQKQSKNTRQSAINDETCDILGTTAVIVNDLKQRREKDYDFDWDRALQSEGDSGIKLQYLHCRLKSLEKNCGVTIPDTCEPAYIPEDIIFNVVNELSNLEMVLQRSYEQYEACILLGYLFRLAKHINKMLKEINVKNVDRSTAEQRLLVFHAARIVVKSSLEILGIRPLDEM